MIPAPRGHRHYSGPSGGLGPGPGPPPPPPDSSSSRRRGSASSVMSGGSRRMPPPPPGNSANYHHRHPQPQYGGRYEEAVVGVGDEYSDNDEDQMEEDDWNQARGLHQPFSTRGTSGLLQVGRSGGRRRTASGGYWEEMPPPPVPGPGSGSHGYKDHREREREREREGGSRRERERDRGREREGDGERDLGLGRQAKRAMSERRQWESYPPLRGPSPAGSARGRGGSNSPHPNDRHSHTSHVYPASPLPPPHHPHIDDRRRMSGMVDSPIIDDRRRLSAHARASIPQPIESTSHYHHHPQQRSSKTTRSGSIASSAGGGGRRGSIAHGGGGGGRDVSPGGLSDLHQASLSPEDMRSYSRRPLPPPINDPSRESYGHFPPPPPVMEPYPSNLSSGRAGRDRDSDHGSMKGGRPSELVRERDRDRSKDGGRDRDRESRERRSDRDIQAPHSRSEKSGLGGSRREREIQRGHERIRDRERDKNRERGEAGSPHPAIGHPHLYEYPPGPPSYPYPESSPSSMGLAEGVPARSQGRPRVSGQKRTYSAARLSPSPESHFQTAHPLEQTYRSELPTRESSRRGKGKRREGFRPDGHMANYPQRRYLDPETNEILYELDDGYEEMQMNLPGADANIPFGAEEGTRYHFPPSPILVDQDSHRPRRRKLNPSRNSPPGARMQDDGHPVQFPPSVANESRVREDFRTVDQLGKQQDEEQMRERDGQREREQGQLDLRRGSTSVMMDASPEHGSHGRGSLYSPALPESYPSHARHSPNTSLEDARHPHPQLSESRAALAKQFDEDFGIAGKGSNNRRDGVGSAPSRGRSQKGTRPPAPSLPRASGEDDDVVDGKETQNRQHLALLSRESDEGQAQEIRELGKERRNYRAGRHEGKYMDPPAALPIQPSRRPQSQPRSRQTSLLGDAEGPDESQQQHERQYFLPEHFGRVSPSIGPSRNHDAIAQHQLAFSQMPDSRGLPPPAISSHPYAPPEQDEVDELDEGPLANQDNSSRKGKNRSGKQKQLSEPGDMGIPPYSSMAHRMLGMANSREEDSVDDAASATSVNTTGSKRGGNTAREGLPAKKRAKKADTPARSTGTPNLSLENPILDTSPAGQSISAGETPTGKNKVKSNGGKKGSSKATASNTPTPAPISRPASVLQSHGQTGSKFAIAPSPRLEEPGGISLSHPRINGDPTLPAPTPSSGASTSAIRIASPTPFYPNSSVPPPINGHPILPPALIPEPEVDHEEMPPPPPKTKAKGKGGKSSPAKKPPKKGKARANSPAPSHASTGGKPGQGDEGEDVGPSYYFTRGTEELASMGEDPDFETDDEMAQELQRMAANYHARKMGNGNYSANPNGDGTFFHQLAQDPWGRGESVSINPAQMDVFLQGLDEMSVARCCWDNCGEGFWELEPLIQHLLDVHALAQNSTVPNKPGEGKKKWCCEWEGCPRKGKPQNSKFSLLSHLRSHTGERPFTCPRPECDKSFTRTDALQKHTKVQHGDEPLALRKYGPKKQVILPDAPQSEEVDPTPPFDDDTERYLREEITNIGIPWNYFNGKGKEKEGAVEQDVAEGEDDEVLTPQEAEAVKKHAGDHSGGAEYVKYIIAKAKLNQASRRNKSLAAEYSNCQQRIDRLMHAKDDALDLILKREIGSPAERLFEHFESPARQASRNSSEDGGRPYPTPFSHHKHASHPLPAVDDLSPGTPAATEHVA